MNIKLYALIRYLQRPNGISIESLQEELNVSRASVFRYLRALQEMNFPITNEIRGRRSYYFLNMSDPFIGRNVFENMPYIKDDFFFDKNEKILIEYLFSNTEKAVPSLSGSLNKLHDKMNVLLSFAGHVAESSSDAIKGNEAIKPKAIRKIDSFQDLPKNTEIQNIEVISTLCDAVSLHKTCLITYHAPNSIAKTYKIMPLAIFSYHGGIYAIVETEDYQYTIKLAIERIESIKVLAETFERKTALDIPWIMTDPFGLVQTDQFEAVMKIRKESASHIMDKAWPEKRVKFSEPDEEGSIYFTVITSGEFELIRWLRYIGTEIELLEPQWLVKKMKASLKELYDMYNPDRN